MIIMIVLTRSSQSFQTGGQPVSSVLWNGRDRTKYHACVIGGVGGHMMILQSTWTGCTIFVAQMGVAGRAGRALQPSDSFLTLISEICCIHIYIYTLSYLQYIQIYTIHTIYTDIYIPTVSTDIYKYIQLYTNICKVEGGVVADCEYVTIMRNTLLFVSLYVRDFNLCDRPWLASTLEF